MQDNYSSGAPLDSFSAYFTEHNNEIKYDIGASFVTIFWSRLLGRNPYGLSTSDIIHLV